MEDQWYDRIRIKFSIRKVTVPLEEQPHLFCWFLKRRILARTWLLSFRKIIRLLVEEMETLAEQLSFWGFDRGYALTQSHSLHLPDYQYWPTARKDNYSTRWIFLVFILVCKRNIDITYQFRVFLLQIPIICCYKLHGPKVICFLYPGTSSKTSLQERRYTNTLYIYLKTIVDNWFSAW